MLNHGLEMWKKKCKEVFSYPRILHNEEDLIQLGKVVGARLSFPQIILLHGCLGAGKTTIAKGIITALSSVPIDDIVSPTFQYMHLYQGILGRIVHFDLYRLATVDDFFSLGLDEFLFDSIALVEWADRIASIIPPEALHIEINICEEGRLLRCSSSVLKAF